MKRKLLSGILAIAAIAFLYTSCKRDTIDYGNSNGSTVSGKNVSQQIALNLSESLYGGLGGFSVSDGITPKINAAPPGRKKITINSLDPDCGMTMDTTLTYSLKVDTLDMTIGGRFKFATICTNGTPSGLTAYDSLKVAMTTPSMIASYNILQNLTVNALDPKNLNSNLTFSGIMNMKADLQYKTGSKQKLSTTFNYKLTSLIISTANDGDIISGTATFETIGDTPQGKWNYKGTITFLGDHKVKIVIDGKSYTVDIRTGQIV